MVAKLTNLGLWLRVDPPAVKLLLEPPGIRQVFAVGFGEIVVTREVFTGTEKHVFMFGVREHRIQRRNRWDADGSRR